MVIAITEEWGMSVPHYSGVHTYHTGVKAHRLQTPRVIPMRKQKAFSSVLDLKVIILEHIIITRKKFCR